MKLMSRSPLLLFAYYLEVPLVLRRFLCCLLGHHSGACRHLVLSEQPVDKLAR